MWVLSMTVTMSEGMFTASMVPQSGISIYEIAMLALGIAGLVWQVLKERKPK
ncbi:MAG: hypothetical protein LBN04_07510 [Oscillospiraceae bacterium]|jgi:hypothetical protein|nr:hypothetical protein [Oscillospiraceae bacterium]